MIVRRILKYGIGFMCSFLVLSLISLYEHRDVLSEYFSTAFSSIIGVGLYILIFAVGIGLMLKALFR